MQMLFILSKILLFLIKPIVWIIALLILTLITKRQKKKEAIFNSKFNLFLLLFE